MQYRDARGQRSRWAPMTWQSAALATTSQVFNQFASDQAVDFSTALAENKLAAGQHKGFSSRDILAYLERTVGKVGGLVSQQPEPIRLLDNRVMPTA